MIYWLCGFQASIKAYEDIHCVIVSYYQCSHEVWATGMCVEYLVQLIRFKSNKTIKCKECHAFPIRWKNSGQVVAY